MTRITKGLLIAFILYFFISGWIDIPNKLFSTLDILKIYLPDGFSRVETFINFIKYFLDKIGWAFILFLIQKYYERRQLSCLPIRCKLLSSIPVKYDSKLFSLHSNKKLKIGVGRYYYHLKLQLYAENNSYFNLSIKNLGNKLQLGDLMNNKDVVIDLAVYCDFKWIIWILPISLTLRFSDDQNIKYKEKIVLINRKGVYSCDIKTPQKK